MNYLELGIHLVHSSEPGASTGNEHTCYLAQKAPCAERAVHKISLCKRTYNTHYAEGAERTVSHGAADLT
jgi:hypothetical protein